MFCRYAREWGGIHVLKSAWLRSSAAAGVAQPHEKYLLAAHSSAAADSGGDTAAANGTALYAVALGPRPPPQQSRVQDVGGAQQLAPSAPPPARSGLRCDFLCCNTRLCAAFMQTPAGQHEGPQNALLQVLRDPLEWQRLQPQPHPLWAARELAAARLAAGNSRSSSGSGCRSRNREATSCRRAQRT